MPKEQKPKKPYPDYPLTPHRNGSWVKKIKGRLVYFGRWREDRDGSKALATYLEQRDALHAGQKPHVKCEGLTVADALNRFLSAKKLAEQSGDIVPATYSQYRRVCDVIAESLGTYERSTASTWRTLRSFARLSQRGERARVLLQKP